MLPERASGVRFFISHHGNILCNACILLVHLQVLVFINTFLSLSDANQVAVIGMTSTTR